MNLIPTLLDWRHREGYGIYFLLTQRLKHQDQYRRNRKKNRRTNPGGSNKEGNCMGDILVGTCSWTDPTLIESGRFYPSWASSAEARLQYYASQYGIVEVDGSYYAVPNERTSRLWVERTGDNFIFDVKAFRLFTHHPTPLTALPRDIREAVPPQPVTNPAHRRPKPNQ